MEGTQVSFGSQLPVGLACEFQSSGKVDPLEGLHRTLMLLDPFEQRAVQNLAAQITPADGLRGFTNPQPMEL
jgi:hypothetical protein